MNCAEFDEIVHELDRKSRGGSDRAEGGPNESEAALVHAESCSRCARTLTEVEGMNFALRSMASHAAGAMAPPRLEATLLREFRRQAAYGKQVGRSGRASVVHQPHRWYAAVAAIAATALVAVGLLFFRSRITPPPPDTGSAATGATTAQTAGIEKKPLPMEQEVVVPSVPRARASTSDTTETEDAAAFYALPYADDSALIEGGAVIRVTVPRSALASWGLPVAGLATGEQIPADLVVSADGTPQAIRLVSQADE